MELKAQKRNIFGKASKNLRKEGLIPAELYGHKIDNLHLSVPIKDFLKAFSEAGESSIINLDIEGEKRPVLIYHISKNSLKDEIENIDFYQVRMDEKVTTKIPVEFIGESPAVKEKDALLIKVVDEIEVEAFPADLPHKIEIDISSLDDFGKSIHAKDLNISSKVKIFLEPDSVLVTVTEKREEETAPIAPVVDVSTVKVETEEKKAERDKEKSVEDKTTK
ncbi:MAG: hypothetical protein A2604_02140 [Candidatus Liptonbacteria bacterium RIFOXYD1_FULL_36_11]|uniref:Large ribosomal subunit protein bL25 n=1 Tax=Candidatus Liptonbacteria bacterium RIFOXYD1_FULL_36_11 TaxID=1798656 RepID=A0A1G2CRT9_9BACT|nr:MAG: hypothetical protein A2604_02140 [Candidatus Liptonbacteria bacterium RIFOXYD1_FULL_36_11]